MQCGCNSAPGHDARANHNKGRPLSEEVLSVRLEPLQKGASYSIAYRSRSRLCQSDRQFRNLSEAIHVAQDVAPVYEPSTG